MGENYFVKMTYSTPLTIIILKRTISVSTILDIKILERRKADGDNAMMTKKKLQNIMKKLKALSYEEGASIVEFVIVKI